jgi:hypothetical protein
VYVLSHSGKVKIGKKKPKKQLPRENHPGSHEFRAAIALVQKKKVGGREEVGEDSLIFLAFFTCFFFPFFYFYCFLFL